MESITYNRGSYCNRSDKFNLKKQTATPPSHSPASYVSLKFSGPCLLLLLLPNLGQQNRQRCQLRHLLHLQYLHSQQIQLRRCTSASASRSNDLRLKIQRRQCTSASACRSNTTNTTSASRSNSVDTPPPPPPDPVPRTRPLPPDPTR